MHSFLWSSSQHKYNVVSAIVDQEESSSSHNNDKVDSRYLFEGKKEANQCVSSSNEKLETRNLREHLSDNHLAMPINTSSNRWHRYNNDSTTNSCSINNNSDTTEKLYSDIDSAPSTPFVYHNEEHCEENVKKEDEEEEEEETSATTANMTISNDMNSANNTLRNNTSIVDSNCGNEIIVECYQSDVEARNNNNNNNNHNNEKYIDVRSINDAVVHEVCVSETERQNVKLQELQPYEYFLRSQMQNKKCDEDKMTENNHNPLFTYAFQRKLANRLRQRVAEACINNVNHITANEQAVKSIRDTSLTDNNEKRSNEHCAEKDVIQHTQSFTESPSQQLTTSTESSSFLMETKPLLMADHQSENEEKQLLCREEKQVTRNENQNRKISSEIPVAFTAKTEPEQEKQQKEVARFLFTPSVEPAVQISAHSIINNSNNINNNNNNREETQIAPVEVMSVKKSVEMQSDKDDLQLPCESNKQNSECKLNKVNRYCNAKVEQRKAAKAIAESALYLDKQTEHEKTLNNMWNELVEARLTVALEHWQAVVFAKITYLTHELSLSNVEDEEWKNYSNQKTLLQERLNTHSQQENELHELMKDAEQSSHHVAEGMRCYIEKLNVVVLHLLSTQHYSFALQLLLKADELLSDDAQVEFVIDRLCSKRSNMLESNDASKCNTITKTSATTSSAEVSIESSTTSNTINTRNTNKAKENVTLQNNKDCTYNDIERDMVLSIDKIHTSVLAECCKHDANEQMKNKKNNNNNKNNSNNSSSSSSRNILLPIKVHVKHAIIHETGAKLAIAKQVKSMLSVHIPYFTNAELKTQIYCKSITYNNFGLYHYHIREYKLSVMRLHQAAILEEQLDSKDVKLPGVTYFNLAQAQFELYKQLKQHQENSKQNYHKNFKCHHYHSKKAVCILEKENQKVFEKNNDNIRSVINQSTKSYEHKIHKTDGIESLERATQLTIDKLHELTREFERVTRMQEVERQKAQIRKEQQWHEQALSLQHESINVNKHRSRCTQINNYMSDDLESNVNCNGSSSNNMVQYGRKHTSEATMSLYSVTDTINNTNENNTDSSKSCKQRAGTLNKLSKNWRNNYCYMSDTVQNYEENANDERWCNQKRNAICNDSDTDVDITDTHTETINNSNNISNNSNISNGNNKSISEELNNNNEYNMRILNLWLERREQLCLLVQIKSLEALWREYSEQYKEALQSIKHAVMWCKEIPQRTSNEEVKLEELVATQKRLRKRCARQSLEREMYGHTLTRRHDKAKHKSTRVFYNNSANVENETNSLEYVHATHTVTPISTPSLQELESDKINRTHSRITTTLLPRVIYISDHLSPAKLAAEKADFIVSTNQCKEKKTTSNNYNNNKKKKTASCFAVYEPTLSLSTRPKRIWNDDTRVSVHYENKKEVEKEKITKKPTVGDVIEKAKYCNYSRYARQPNKEVQACKDNEYSDSYRANIDHLYEYRCTNKVTSNEVNINKHKSSVSGGNNNNYNNFYDVKCKKEDTVDINVEVLQKESGKESNLFDNIVNGKDNDTQLKSSQLFNKTKVHPLNKCLEEVSVVTKLIDFVNIINAFIRCIMSKRASHDISIIRNSKPSCNESSTPHSIKETTLPNTDNVIINCNHIMLENSEDRSKEENVANSNNITPSKSFELLFVHSNKRYNIQDPKEQNKSKYQSRQEE